MIFPDPTPRIIHRVRLAHVHFLLSEDARSEYVELRARGYAPSSIAVMIRAIVDALDAIPPDRL